MVWLSYRSFTGQFFFFHSNSQLDKYFDVKIKIPLTLCIGYYFACIIKMFSKQYDLTYRKKGSSYGIDIVETGKSYVETVVMDAPAAEHDGKCKCGPSCSCTSCTCGH
ncbi:hypothetical protein LguiA_023115 [Lonicera macranthoides]